MPALFTRAPGDGRQAGWSSIATVSIAARSCSTGRGCPTALARRGISTLCVDQPGTGEALRLRRLPVDPHERALGVEGVDWLETQPDVDPTRLGMTGISLGGYFAPRAVAFEPRFAAGAVWGANHNWAEVQHKRLRREGENPVPHYWGHVFWVFGATRHGRFPRQVGRA